MANELLQRSTCANTFRTRCASPVFQAAARLKLDPGADVSRYKVNRKCLKGPQLRIELHDGIRTTKAALWTAVTDGIPALAEYLPEDQVAVTKLAKEVLDEAYKYGVLNMVTVRGGASGVLRWLVHHASPTCASKEVARKLGVSFPTPFNVFSVVKQLLTPAKLAHFSEFKTLAQTGFLGTKDPDTRPPFRNDKHFSERRMKKARVRNRVLLKRLEPAKSATAKRKRVSSSTPNLPKIQRRTLSL